MTELNYRLDRSIIICAKRPTVFRYFTDSSRWADWWGAGSTIEGRAGGEVKIIFPGGIRVSGKVLEIEEGKRIVFTYGFDSGNPIPAGSSRVTIHLSDHPEGTQLDLHHEFSDQKVRDEHVQGWRFQLAIFANVAAADQFKELSKSIDAYFEMWNMTDGEQRRKAMSAILDPDCHFQDLYSCTLNLDDLNAHISAGKQFMPGLTLVRDGGLQQCQGTAICNWIAQKSDGTQVGRGSNVYSLNADGFITKIVGFWIK